MFFFLLFVVLHSSQLPQAALAGALSAPYLLQRLGNFDPGLEFKIAMAYADASAISSPNSLEGGAGGVCDVVLGDRDVQETLRRLGKGICRLTYTSMWRMWCTRYLLCI